MTNFDQRIKELPPTFWGAIAKIDEIKGHWNHGAALHPYQLTNLKKSVLITSTGASTRIEGGTLSDAEVEKLIRGVKQRKNETRDEQEVRGCFELLERIFDLHGSVPFSESSILSLHHEMLKYVEKDASHRGKYKTLENTITAVGERGEATVVMKTAPPYLVRKEMEALLDWTRERLAAGDIHPLPVIANFVVEFLKIHPFQDGNGRLSRLLTNLLLLRSGYAFVPYVSLEKIIERRRQDYYLALRRSQITFGTDRESIAPWATFFAEVMTEQAEKAVALMDKTGIEEMLTAKQLDVYNAVLSGKGVGAGVIAAKTGIARPTVNQALGKLLRLRKISKVGMGRGTTYWPTRK